MWDALAQGAIGAIVLVDTRRLDSSFGAIDFFEHRSIPFVAAVNCFDNGFLYDVAEVRQALAISESIPLMLCDARQREPIKLVLITLLEHTMNTLPVSHQGVA